MDRMTQVTEEHGGFVDDYAGDGIKASFGAPITRASSAQVAQDACRAVRCALAMGRTLEELNVSARYGVWCPRTDLLNPPIPLHLPPVRVVAQPG